MTEAAKEPKVGWVASGRPLPFSHRRLTAAVSSFGWPDAVGLLLAVLGSLAAVSWSLQLWNAHLHVPFIYESDALQSQLYVKSVISGGWIWNFHGLGAPFGAEQFDFPQGTDSLNFLTMKLIGLFTQDSGKAINLFFLSTFVSVAVAAFIVLRWLGVSIVTSVVCTILFADAPYHLFRNEAHLLLSSYPTIPAATYLIIKLLDGRGLFSLARQRSGSVRRYFSLRNTLMATLCVAIGSLGLYYALFTIFLVGAAGIASSIRRRGWRPLAEAMLVIALIGSVSIANDVPAALYRSAHGSDPAVATRSPAESELYALKLAEMVLPVPGDRIAALSKLRNTYDTTTPVLSEGSQQSLGIVASAGFLWLLLLSLLSILGLGRGAPWASRHRQLSFVTMVAFLLGTMGGLSAVLAYVITAQIRGWNRISIFIAFFSLTAVAFGLDALRRRLGRRLRGLWLVLTAVVLLVGIVDQSSRLVIPDYKVIEARYSSDGQFVGEIQGAVPHDAAIFELPYFPYPENGPILHSNDYDESRGWLHTTTGLRWSYGAIKGRPQDWANEAQDLPVPTLVDALVGAGFAGIFVDRWGYADNGAATSAELGSLTGVAPLISGDQRFVFFSLTSLAARLRARYSAQELSAVGRDLVRPVVPGWTGGFYADESGSRWSSSDGVAQIDNTSHDPQRMVFSAEVLTLAHGRWRLTLRAPDGEVKHFAITTRPTPILMFFNDPPGHNKLTLTSNAPVVHVPPDPRALAVRYNQLVLGGASLAPFLPR